MSANIQITIDFMHTLAKKIIAAVIISITIVSNYSLAYEDVDSNDPYYYAVEHLRRNNVIIDGKLFQPELVINKAEFVKYLVKLNNPDFLPGTTAELPYTDTQNNAYYAPYFKEAINLGILKNEKVNIYPFKKLNSIDALELLFHSKSMPIPNKYIGAIPYEDVKGNKASQALVMRAINLGLVEAERYDYFGIYRKINRAEAAEMLFRMEMLSLGNLEVNQPNIDQPEFEKGLQKIISSWELINANYVDQDKVNKEDLSRNAINALLDTLDDPYSNYLDPKSNGSFSDELEGEFEGIGAYLAIEEDGQITIVSPIKDTPAYEAGLKPGDIIKAVDSWSTEGAGLQEVVNKIKGPRGTDVTLTLLRKGQEIRVTITRRLINIKALEYEVIENGTVMLAKLITFNENASDEMREMAEIVANSKEIKGIILDLRGNPGGLLDSAIEIISMFVPSGSTAVRIQYNYFNVAQETTSDGLLKDVPVVVLIDKGSASASEILAGALQEVNGSTLVGETSFGKGTVQEVNFFDDNSSIKITVAKWLTPEGHSIQGNGIKPDIEVELGAAEQDDRQLNRAIQELLKKIQ